MRMDKKQYAALKELMQLNFVMTELRLYLDTHPSDVEALQTYNIVAMRYHKKLMEYQRRYGMIHADAIDHVNPERWSWIDSPWPWEIEYR
ncbi:MAG: cotJB [Clostridiales bacterium]|jgi:spore coat protein JB|nr:cotJB [Clostridiales bacterium]